MPLYSEGGIEEQRIGKLEIERNEAATFSSRDGENRRVISPRQVLVGDRQDVMPSLLQRLHSATRKILVELELHEPPPAGTST